MLPGGGFTARTGTTARACASRGMSAAVISSQKSGGRLWHDQAFIRLLLLCSSRSVISHNGETASSLGAAQIAMKGSQWQ